MFLILIDFPDNLLQTGQNNNQRLLVNKEQRTVKMQESMTHEEHHRPWGFYENLVEASDHKVKRITVFPGHRLSLQSHERRAEHWFIVKGSADVTLNKVLHHLKAGDSINIGLGEMHRIENTGSFDLIFVEVQTGDYFGEDDIRRFQDDYDRA